MRFLSLLLLSLSLAACAHEAENTGQQNSSSIIHLPATYAMQAANTDSPVAAGSISRFERKTIVPGGMDGDMDPCARNFDGVMDHLEGLMAKKIAENNEIAAKQAAIPGYKF